MADYTIDYTREDGTQIAAINQFTTLDYTKVVGDVGFCILTSPRQGKVWERNQRDYRLHVSRNGQLDFVGFITQVQYMTDSDGKSSVVITAASPEILLRRRIAAYYASDQAGTTTNKSDFADDIMKAVVADNLVSNADYSGTPSPSRTISFLAVQKDASAGPTLQKSFAWQNVLQILQELQAASKAADNEVFFTFQWSGRGALQFQTRTGEPGRDLSAGNTNQVIFSVDRGNLQNPTLTYDYTDEINKVYGIGQGQEGEQLIATAQNDGRVNFSAVGLSEASVNAYGLDTAEITAAAEDELSRHRPMASLSADLLSYSGYQGFFSYTSTEYRKHWNLGDRVTIEYEGFSFDVIIRSVNVNVNEDGKETIRARVEDLVYVERTR